MSDTLVAGGASVDEDGVVWVTDLEDRASVPPLEKLQHDRRQLVSTHAKLLALYGNFGMYDDHRKRLVQALMVKVRMDLKSRGEKSTESWIESEAYGSPEYQSFLDRCLEDKVSNRISEITENIRSRELALLAYNAELKLAR